MSSVSADRAPRPTEVMTIKLADAAGRLGPATPGGKRLQMGLVVEARHRVVGLRLEPRARDAHAAQRREHRQPPAMQQLMHQRGDEDGLAGAGEAGDAEPDGRIDQPGAELADRAGGEADFFGDVAEEARSFI